MPTIITAILRVAGLVLSGVGVSDLLDKFVKDKVPAQYYPEPISPGLKVPKLVWLTVAFLIAATALKFIGKTFKIKILKY